MDVNSNSVYAGLTVNTAAKSGASYKPSRPWISMGVKIGLAVVGVLASLAAFVAGIALMATGLAMPAGIALAAIGSTGIVLFGSLLGAGIGSIEMGSEARLPTYEAGPGSGFEGFEGFE